MRLDVTSGAREVYRYGADVMVEEHVFVPQPGAGGREGEGWLIGTALDLRRQHMLFSVFDAQHLADGPIAQGELPRVAHQGPHAAGTARHLCARLSRSAHPGLEDTHHATPIRTAHDGD